MADIIPNFTYVGLKRPTVFAHRGSSAYAPENTLAAFEMAVEQGADAIELDVKLSGDGQIIVIHDDTVDRTTDGTGRVGAMTLSELKDLDAGSYFNTKFKTEKIPTLEDVFETFGKRIFINIEIKNYTTPLDDLPERVISLINKFDLEDNVILTSFNFIALIRTRDHDQNIPVGLLTPAGVASLAVTSKLVRFGPSVALHPSFVDVKPKLIQSLHRARSRIHAYTLKEADDMRQLFRLGVDGIITSNPPLAKSVLSEIESYKP